MMVLARVHRERVEYQLSSKIKTAGFFMQFIEWQKKAL